MRIALCDDERRENERIASLIEDYAAMRDYDIRCESFTDGESLLAEEKFDLYLLDYRLENETGVEIARALKEKYNRAVSVCFLTSYESAAVEVINAGVYADGFLKKPVEPALLYEKLEAFYKRSFFQRLELKKGASWRTVYARDILYIEGAGKKGAVHFFDRVEEFNYLLADMENEVLKDGSFYRIHRSYIVNLSYVSAYDTKSVTLQNGEKLPLKAKGFQQAYRRFIFTMEGK